MEISKTLMDCVWNVLFGITQIVDGLIKVVTLGILQLTIHTDLARLKASWMMKNGKL